MLVYAHLLGVMHEHTQALSLTEIKVFLAFTLILTIKYYFRMSRACCHLTHNFSFRETYADMESRCKLLIHPFQL